MAALPLPDPEATRVAKLFLARVAGEYPVEEAWLYGSRARGDARPDSDVDVAFVMKMPRATARNASIELAGDAFDVMMETGFFISPLAISADDWSAPDRYSNPFLIRNIRRDGVRL